VQKSALAGRPGSVEIHTIDVGQQINTKRRITQLDHLIGYFEIINRQAETA